MTKEFNYEEFLKDQITIPGRLLKSYHSLGLSETEVVVILQIHQYQMEGNQFPTPSEISSFLTLSEQECSNILRKLIQKNILTIQQNQNDQNVLNETYSLEELWKTLYNNKGPVNKEKEAPHEQFSNIFVLFEQEFGRPLSPFEIETINMWIDEEIQSPSLIKAALREAVLMGKLNFRYIDRILREWKRKGVKTVEQARNQSKSFHSNQTAAKSGTDKTERDVSLYYNWLEED